MSDGEAACSTAAPARVTVDLTLDDPAWLDAMPRAGEAASAACVAALESACPGPALAVSLVLSDDRRVASLNSRWRNVDGPTDVLSFPSDERSPGLPPPVPQGAPDGSAVELGDVVIARETLARDARAGDRPLGDHLAHIVVHGTLHLLGYDHDTETRAETMEAVERTVLAGLGVPDPYR